jgi:hypothetical protein
VFSGKKFPDLFNSRFGQELPVPLSRESGQKARKNRVCSAGAGRPPKRPRFPNLCSSLSIGTWSRRAVRGRLRHPPGLMGFFHICVKFLGGFPESPSSSNLDRSFGEASLSNAFVEAAPAVRFSRPQFGLNGSLKILNTGCSAQFETRVSISSPDAEGFWPVLRLGPHSSIITQGRARVGGRPGFKPASEECELCQAKTLKCGRCSRLIATG